MSAVDRIVAVLQEHRYLPECECSCGHDSAEAAPENWAYHQDRHHDPHVAQRVAAVVKPDVERLARALWNADKPWMPEGGNPYGELKPQPWDDATEHARESQLWLARKVLAELDQEET